MRLIAVAALLTCLGCAFRPASAWQPAEAEIAAWWCEDVAHGLVRDPGELDLVAGSPRAADVARWAAGSDLAGRWDMPHRLAARKARWPAIQALLASGEAIRAGDSGLLSPAPGVVPARRSAVSTLVDAENDDRRFIDAIVRTVGRPDPGVERAHDAAVRCARRTLDAPAGAGDRPADRPVR